MLGPAKRSAPALRKSLDFIIFITFLLVFFFFPIHVAKEALEWDREG